MFDEFFFHFSIKVRSSTLFQLIEGSRPANTCVPPSFLGNAHAQLPGAPTPKESLMLSVTCKPYMLSVMARL
jgi:hypothetical protein